MLNFIGEYNKNMNFQRGWGVFKTKKPSMGAVWVFPGTTHNKNICSSSIFKIIEDYLMPFTLGYDTV